MLPFFMNLLSKFYFMRADARRKNKSVKHRLLFDKPQSATFTESHVLPYLYYHKSGFLYSVFTVFLPICKLCLRPAPAAAPSSRTTGTAARFRCPPCPPSGARAAHSAAPPWCTLTRPRAYPRAPHSACRERGRTARRSAPFRQSTRFCFRGRAHGPAHAPAVSPARQCAPA